eukprot:338938_1
MGDSLTTTKNTEEKYEDINVICCREEIDSLKRELKQDNFWNEKDTPQLTAIVNSNNRDKLHLNSNLQQLPHLKNNFSMEKFLIPSIQNTQNSNACRDKEEIALIICWMKGVLHM